MLCFQSLPLTPSDQTYQDWLLCFWSHSQWRRSSFHYNDRWHSPHMACPVISKQHPNQPPHKICCHRCDRRIIWWGDRGINSQASAALWGHVMAASFYSATVLHHYSLHINVALGLSLLWFHGRPPVLPNHTGCFESIVCVYYLFNRQH